MPLSKIDSDSLNSGLIFSGQQTIPTINLTGGQITFPATQVPSSDANTLDDYEEGTFTPVITFGGGSVGQTYDSQAGVYTRIGRLVTVNGIFSMTNNGSSTGIASLTGLPFSIATYGSGTLMGDGITGTFAQIGLLFVPGACYLATQIGGTGSLGGWGNMNQTFLSAGGKYFAMTYMTS